MMILLAYLVANMAAGTALGAAALFGSTLLPTIEDVGKVLITGAFCSAASSPSSLLSLP